MSMLRPIAFYLPQFHPIPENDQNWGPGFTEWNNVVRARPQFPGHEQPHLPADLGFYDLRLPDVMQAQAALAQQYGIHGFCFYHYWFGGRRLLEQPLHQMLRSAQPEQPFCLCWANENWTRTWDGGDHQVLVEQHYSDEDDLAHLRYLLEFFRDPRYIKIDGRPVFLMYRSELHPDIVGATRRWRDAAIKAGFPDLYLVRVENFQPLIDPAMHGFDAGVEFSPCKAAAPATFGDRPRLLRKLRRVTARLGLHDSVLVRHKLRSMPAVADLAERMPAPSYTRFRCVSPSWDNSARRESMATIYVDATPDLFERWTRFMAEYTRRTLPASQQLLFINAWNEWGEGCHLEPCQRHGHAYLQAFARAIDHPVEP